MQGGLSYDTKIESRYGPVPDDPSLVSSLGIAEKQANHSSMDMGAAKFRKRRQRCRLHIRILGVQEADRQ